MSTYGVGFKPKEPRQKKSKSDRQSGSVTKIGGGGVQPPAIADPMVDICDKCQRLRGCSKFHLSDFSVVKSCRFFI